MDTERRRIVPSNANEKFEEGMNCYKLYKYEEATYFFKESIDLFGRFSESIVKLAECYRILGLCKEAEDLCVQVCFGL
jgi:thioredoxin-like negative regulator of GroEL